MKILENVIANKNLEFTDASTGTTIPVGTLYRSLGLNPVEKGLLFLYNNNQLSSIEVLLNFYGTAHTIALLGQKLHEEFKGRIEAEYRPKYIFDPQREAIEGYTLKAFSDNISIFAKDDYQSEVTIHPEIKILLSTSGTTGVPKLVKLSDESLYQNALSILQYMPVQETDVVPLNVPINFVYGFSIFTTNCMRAGRIVCTDKDIMQKAFWDEMMEYGYSTLGGVPFLYENLNRIGFFRKDSPSLRYFTHTGGVINAELRKTIFSYCHEFKKISLHNTGKPKQVEEWLILRQKDCWKEKPLSERLYITEVSELILKPMSFSFHTSVFLADMPINLKILPRMSSLPYFIQEIPPEKMKTEFIISQVE